MKKILLSALLGAACLSVAAQDYTEYFSVTLNGEELASGSTIYADHFELPFLGPEVYPVITNNSVVDLKILTGLAPVTPSLADVQADMNKWGMVQLCYSGNCFMDLNADNANAETEKYVPCYGFMYGYNLPKSNASQIEMQPHVMYFGDEIPSDYRLEARLFVAPVDEPEAMWEANVIFISPSAGVETLVGDNAAPEYFTLQGIRVSNPQPGQLYIVRQGAKVKKQILK